VVAAAFTVGAWGPPAGATEPGGGGGVTGEGTAAIERAPQLMRMQVDLTGTGGGAKAALASLRASEKTAREKLAALGAPAAAISLGDVRVAQRLPSRTARQQAELDASIRVRIGGGAAAAQAPTSAPASAPAPAPPVYVSASLIAEWPLKAAAGDERIAEAVDLQAKVRAAGVVAPVPATDLTPEQQELAEEAAAGMAPDGDGESPNGMPAPGEPVFSFASRISDDERQKATADAFARARADAARLATAAQARLGALRELSAPTGTGPEAEDFAESTFGNYSYFGGGEMTQLRMAALSRRPPGAPAEAVGLQPGKVTYRVNVTATFALEQQ
jgi:hypothetical protein